MVDQNQGKKKKKKEKEKKGEKGEKASRWGLDHYTTGSPVDVKSPMCKRGLG